MTQSFCLRVNPGGTTSSRSGAIQELDIHIKRQSTPGVSMAASSSNSVNNSVASSAHPQQPKEEQDVSSEITALKPKKVDPLAHVDKEEIEKFKKYEADYSRYLMAKYFSDKNVFGGNIFDVKMNMDGQTIKASRLPPYASFADPLSFLEHLSSESTSAPETPSNTSNGNHSTKKSN